MLKWPVLHLLWLVSPAFKRGGLILALLAWGWFAAFAGQTWYVSTTGSDTNSGTSANAALAHVQTAVNRATYGDTVNLQAGTYREQVFIPLSWPSNAAVGSLASMLTIQAWDTNGDGIIESNEVPTINAFQSLTNWTALTDANVWSALTGGAAYQPNAIFWTYWSTNDTANEPLELVMQSDTVPLQLTGWTNFHSCDHPLYMPANMYPGTFQYDYAGHILYVWRSDAQAPGPANPVQAVYIDPGLNTSWGDNGPFASQADYIHLKNIAFRFCNATVDSARTYTPSGLSLQHYSIVESCDVQWMAYQGVNCWDGTEITNCIVSNNGELGIGTGGSNTVIFGCLLATNNFRHFVGGCLSEGAVHVAGIPSGNRISANTFVNNDEDAVHLDTAFATPSNLCVIANNFISITNYPDGTCGSGIDLEISSYCNIYDNIIVSCGGTAILLSGAHGNFVVNNSVAISGDPNGYPPQALILTASAARDPGHQYDLAFNTVANNIFVSRCNGAILATYNDSTDVNATTNGAICYSNVYTGNLLWNYLPGTNLYVAPIQISVFSPPYLVPTAVSNVAGWAQAISGTDAPFRNVGNTNVDPLFFNVGNTTNPANPNYYTLRWDSPARNAGGATNYGVTTDFLGNPRGPSSDLGAYQADMLFADDFAHTGTLSPWVYESGAWSVTGGALIGQNAASGPGIVYLASIWADYFVQANIRFGSTTGYGAGLSARLNPATGARYAAYVYPEESPAVSFGSPLVKLIKFQGWTNWSYLGISNQPMAVANLAAVGTSWHTLQLALQGKQITVYLDGSNVLSVADAETGTYSSGGAGVDMSTTFPSYTYSVSNLAVASFSPWVANSGEWAVTGGSLRGTNTLGGNYGNAYLTNIWTNYSVQGSIQFSTINAYGGGLAGRLNPATGTRYAAYIYPEGSPIDSNAVPMLKLIKFQSWTNFGYQGIGNAPMGQVALSGVGTNWHALALSFQGASITVSLDGNLELSVADAESTTYPTGAIGMEAYYDQVPYTFSVTNVTVSLSGNSQSKPPPPSNLRMQITP